MTPEEKAKDLELMADRLQRGAGSTVVLGTGIHNEPNVDSDNEIEGGDMKDGPSHHGGQAQQGWGGGQVEENDFDAPDNPDGGQNSARGDGQVSGRREKADFDDGGGTNRGSRNTRPTSGSVQRGPTLKASMSSNGDSEPIVQKVAEQPKKFGRRQPGFGGSTAEIKKGPTDRFETTETVTDLKEIPDLDAEAEERTEEFTQKIEHAPNVRAKQVQTLQDLDQNIMGQLSSITADGIDLSLLTSVLAPPEQVVEPDSMWDYDSVFAQLSSEMQPENEGDDEEGGGASSPTNKDNSSSGNGGPQIKPPAGIEFKESKKPN